ncbi:hypothetical protein [Campylobacter sp.]|uniref:hypothetical protein n=1 Tax=Campylobacter sp. TaxID=205 RepID=UPI002583B135|nr:hypothetical protein [Campylobacter sp.]MCI6641438.1 hypothetical protein [Campylobacter sp.]
MYIVLYHCGEDEFYFYNSLAEIEKDFPHYKNDEYFVGIYKIDEIIYGPSKKL